jgi:hypothetical protein
MLASALAQVVIRDPHPTEALRLGDHPLQHLAVSLLDVNPAAQLALSLAETGRERVADAFELGHPQDLRPAYGRDAEPDSLARKCCREELREPPLQLGDLAAQVLARGELDVGPGAWYSLSSGGAMRNDSR